MIEEIRRLKQLIQQSGKVAGKIENESYKRYPVNEPSIEDLYGSSKNMQKFSRFEGNILELEMLNLPETPKDYQSEYWQNIDMFISVKGFDESFLKIREHILASHEQDLQRQQYVDEQSQDLLWHMVDDSYPLTKKDIYEQLVPTKQQNYTIPSNVLKGMRAFHISDFKYFGAGFDGRLLPEDNAEIRQLVKEGYLPEFMLKFMLLGQYEHLAIGTFLYDDEKEDGEIMGYDFEDQSFVIISNSMKNFIRRGIACCEAGIEQHWLNPTDEALTIIREIDGDAVAPDGYVYRIGFYDDWREHWCCDVSN